jgi:hypothetical protein
LNKVSIRGQNAWDTEAQGAHRALDWKAGGGRPDANGTHAKLGEYQSFVARLESGQRRVDVVELLEIAAILGFNPIDAIERLSAIKG